MQIQRIVVADYCLRSSASKDSYVQYILLVHGKTPNLHPSAYYDPDSCLFTDCPVFTIYSRFSQLSELHKALQTHHRSLRLPEFPPKRWLGNRHEAFLQERKQLLSAYFELLLELPHIQTSPLLCDFCRPEKELNIAVVGCEGVGKVRLLDGFMNYSRKSLHSDLPTIGHRKASRIDPADYSFPLDIIIRKRLLRILSIDLVQISDSLPAPSLDRYHGLIFTYSHSVQSSYLLVKRVRPECPAPSVVVGLDHNGDPGFASYSAESVGDAYEVFEELLVSLISDA
jgi:hypothetical protein